MLSKETFTIQKSQSLTKRPKKKYGPYGKTPIPPRAAANEMFSMLTKGQRTKNRPIVKICINLGYNHKTSVDDVMKWGAALCTFINNLEEEGKNVHLIGAYDLKPSHSRGKGPKVSFQITLKPPEQNLSMAKLVFWLAHPSALRRVGLSALERLDVQRWYEASYGLPASHKLCGKDALYLSIDDAGASAKASLEILRHKYNAMNKSGNYRQPQIQKKAV